MSNSKRQSLIVIGFGLIILAGIILYFAFSIPKVNDKTVLNKTVTISETYSISQQISNKNGNSESSIDYPININTCTVDDLVTINGIGEKKASAIVEYRDVIGGYTSVEEIKNIKGIGDKVFDKISPYLCV